MIESIRVSGVASYDDSPQTLANLSTFNFLFGPNGSGKTTISRIIADERAHPTCDVTWQDDRELRCMVYNRDFVERNFSQSEELKGVFTLGEEQVDTLSKIEAAKSEIERLSAKLKSLRESLDGSDGQGGKQSELRAIEEELKARCWEQKRRHDDAFSAAFAGVRNSGERFKAKALEARAVDSAPPPPLDELITRAGTVFGPAPVHEPLIQVPEASELLKYETAPLLQRKVVGKEDIDIARLIQRLGNSDWVRRGREYLDSSEGSCPFCQQPLPASFAAELEAYFDESYRQATDELKEMMRRYSGAAERLQDSVTTLREQGSRFLDTEALEALSGRLDATLKLNLERIGAKTRSPAEAIALESLADSIEVLTKLIENANDQATAHNQMVSNLDAERRTLTDQVWQHIVQVELKDAFAEYDKKRSAVDKAIEAIETKLSETDEQRRAKIRELHSLERQTTSIEPTMTGINALLQSVGFTGFSIQQAESRNAYKLVREDGTDAKETLSEGEQSFVTFLYFYHLIRGSQSESGISTDRIVVFDDPVSSLDSDVLFIVSSLIKGLFQDVRDGSGSVQQVFVLTHNVYFHREVTFNPRRSRDAAMREETFWVVRKIGTRSVLTGHTTNPVRTSYDLLWEEVRNPTHSSVTIQNTLRRILENYFTILGSVDPAKIVEQFQGSDRAICSSLFSWVNAGSHYAFDDLYVAVTDSTENYLRVFREVFERSGQIGHYRMMMGDADVDDSDANAPPR